MGNSSCNLYPLKKLQVLQLSTNCLILQDFILLVDMMLSWGSMVGQWLAVLLYTTWTCIQVSVLCMEFTCCPHGDSSKYPTQKICNVGMEIPNL